MKEAIVVATVVVVTFTLILGLSVAVMYWIGPRSCDAQTVQIGLPHRWSFWGNCQVQVEDGRWIPLENYRWFEEDK